MRVLVEGAHERAMATGRNGKLCESLLKELMSAQWRSSEMENLSESFYGRSSYMFKRAFWIQVPIGNRMMLFCAMAIAGRALHVDYVHGHDRLDDL